VNGSAINRSSFDCSAPLHPGDNFIVAGRATSPFKFRLTQQQV
jgi:hypothetical protein